MTATTSEVASSISAREAAESAGRAALAAAAAAATNAAKAGASTSEFKLSIAALLWSAGLAALHALTAIPGPWQLPAVLGAAALGGAAAYSNSRAKVKSAALGALAGVAGALAPVPVAR